jgi:hypothetical protein
MQDPPYWRERDRDFADDVTRQFQHVHGPDGPRPTPTASAAARLKCRACATII